MRKLLLALFLFASPVFAQKYLGNYPFYQPTIIADSTTASYQAHKLMRYNDTTKAWLEIDKTGGVQIRPRLVARDDGHYRDNTYAGLGTYAKSGDSLYSLIGAFANGSVSISTRQVPGNNTLDQTFTVWNDSTRLRINNSDEVLFTDQNMRFNDSYYQLGMISTDAADNKVLGLTGGGANANTRGAMIDLYGNEYVDNNGYLKLSAGVTANGCIQMFGEAGNLNVGVYDDSLRINLNGINEWLFKSSGQLIFTNSSNIFAGTSDAADNLSLSLSGGGANSNGRGAFLTIQGNEAGGNVIYSVGNAANTGHKFETSNATRVIVDENVGRSRVTVGATAGTGAGKLYAGDSIYVASTLFADASRNVSAGSISGTTGTFSTGILPSTTATVPVGAIGQGFSRMVIEESTNIADGLILTNTGAGFASPRIFFDNPTSYAGSGIALRSSGANQFIFSTNATPLSSSGTTRLILSLTAGARPSLTIGSVAGTGAGILYAGDSIYVASTLFADASRNIAVGTVTASGAVAPGGLTVQGGPGVAAVNDTVRWTAQTVDVAAQNFANTATGKLYRVTYYAHTTTTEATAATLQLLFAWNDGAAQTINSALLALASSTGYIQDTFVIYVASGTPTWAADFVGVIGSPQAAWNIVIERLW